LHASAPDFVEAVAALVQPGETGWRSGRDGGFTPPVARRARQVLAVDLSDAMLAALAAKLARAGIGNVRLMTAEWPEVAVEPHDVVLAANSLYRVPEIGDASAR
jgi:ubiquinone/menaquinone biosynthesis C-methylase UbiE